MKCYIVTFETNSELTRNKVRKVLKTYRRYCPIHKYCWAIITDEVATQVRSKVQSMLGVEEKINIKMHIKKIMRDGQIGETGAPETDEEPHIPFREIE